MTTGAMGTGAAGTGATGATGAGATGATGAAGTGATGAAIKDKRLNKITVDVPEKYKNEAWAKEVTSVDDLFDKMAGAQKLIGKDKIVLPGDGATAEELEAFQIRMGRPETAEGYEFNSISELQEVERNVDLDTGMKKIFLKNGVSKKAGEGIVNDYESLIYSMNKPTIEASAQRNMDFQALADETLGEDKASSVAAFKTVMKESLGDKAYLVDKIEHMSNEELMPLIVFSKNIHDKYTGENRVQSRPGHTTAMTGDLKTDFQALSQKKIAIKNDNNMPAHIKKLQLANLNTQIIKIGGKASEAGVDLFK